jgi:cell division protein FtsB
MNSAGNNAASEWILLNGYVTRGSRFFCAFDLSKRLMKIIFGFLGFAFITLQYQLWLGEDSVRTLNMLELEVEAQRVNNAGLEQRNRLVEIEVLDLKNGLEAVEERARSELGMIEKGETFYLLVPAQK